MQRNFNFIYDKLVKNDNDTVGLIAYGLYKKKKINFIISFKERNGRDITEDELAQFHISSEEHIDSYRLQAEVLSHDFAEEYTNEDYNALEEEYRQKLVEAAAKMKTSLWEGAFQSLAGSILLLFVIGAIVLILQGFQFNFWKSVENIARAASQSCIVQPSSNNDLQPNNPTQKKQ